MSVLQAMNVDVSATNAHSPIPLTRESLAEFTGRLRALSEGAGTVWPGESGTPPESGPVDLLAALRQRDAELRLAEGWLHEQQEELERTRRLLALERSRFRELFENAPDAYVTTDAKGVILAANRRGAALLGMPSSSLEGKLLISFVTRGDTRLFRDRFKTLRNPSSPRVLELQVRPRGKRPFLVSMTVHAVHDVDGQSTGHQWTIRRMGPPVTDAPAAP